MSVRSAKSGEFVKASEALVEPDSTVTETGKTNKLRRPASKRAAAKSKKVVQLKACDNCHFKGDGSGLVDETTLCPQCQGSGKM